MRTRRARRQKGRIEQYDKTIGRQILRHYDNKTVTKTEKEGVLEKQYDKQGDRKNKRDSEYKTIMETERESHR